jgi:hypothetical protein
MEKKGTSLTALLQRMICFLASFDVERYRQLKWSYPKAIVTARGVAVFIPSAVVASTLAMWGPAIFGSMGETVLFVVMLPLTVFIIDYALIAHSYSGEKVPAGLNFVRGLMMLLSIALNVFVVAGANSGSLLPDIEEGVRQDTRFSSRLDQLAVRENANTEELKKLRTEKESAEDAGNRVKRLVTLREAERAGATLSDGVQRIHGNGTKAQGYNLEIEEASQIAAGAGQARKGVEEAEKAALRLQEERMKLDAEIVQEMKNRQSPGLMVSALYAKIVAGSADVLMSTALLLMILVVIDCSALILSHVPTPPALLQMARSQTDVDLAVAELDAARQLAEINSQHPHVEVKISSDQRHQEAWAKVFNMRNEATGQEAGDGERRSA